jgi:hypothetical protein
MQIVFTKGAGKYDIMQVIRADQATQRVDCPKQGIIPHDMVHYAVEQTLHARGFLTRVQHGEDAGFRMAADADSDAVERLVEVFQADAWSGGGSTPDDLIAMYRITCDARQCPALPLDASAINAVRECIADLGARWQAVTVGGSLTLNLSVPV